MCSGGGHGRPGVSHRKADEHPHAHEAHSRARPMRGPAVPRRTAYAADKITQKGAGESGGGGGRKARTSGQGGCLRGERVPGVRWRRCGRHTSQHK